MKRWFGILVVCLFTSNFLNAQQFKGNFSAMFGLPNVKIRLQYEHPISPRSSVGLNTNYHFLNWKGPMVESFARIYSKNFGNVKGVFGQLKMCYGNFTYFKTPTYITNERFAVYGGGMGGGYKFLVAPHFTIETYGGLRIISGPNADRVNTNSWLESVGWYVWTGFPIELHAKLGYQF